MCIRDRGRKVGARPLTRRCALCPSPIKLPLFTTNLRHERGQPFLLQTDLFDALAQAEHGVGGVDAVLGLRHELQLSRAVLGVQLLEVDAGAQQLLLGVVQETLELGQQLRRVHLYVGNYSL